MAEAPSSFATSVAADSIYSVGSPSKFDITVFPNASTINVLSKDTEKKKKVAAPNPALRPLENIPKQMTIKEDEEDDIVINKQKSEAPSSKFGYQYPTKRDKLLRIISTAIAILAALLIVTFYINSLKNIHIIHILLYIYIVYWIMYK